MKYKVILIKNISYLFCETCLKFMHIRYFLSGIMALDASYFVSKALQNSLSWTSLAMILKDLAPTLDEANDVISILLKELETLQSTLQQKDKELENA